MTGERKPMSIDEVEAVLRDLPTRQLDELLDGILSQRTGAGEDFDPAELAECSRTR